MAKLRAIVIGAGVGGLSAAYALREAGLEVHVFERAPEFRVEGFGLNLWPNSARAISEMGLSAEFGDISVPLQTYWTIDSQGRIVHQVDVSRWPSRYGAPATGVFRRSLSTMFLDRLDAGSLHFGYNLISVEETSAKVIARFDNGVELEGDLLIGADGIHSATRRLLFGDFSLRPNPHHGSRWRGIVAVSDTEADPHGETEVYGGRSFFGTIPIGNGLMYWFASGAGLSDWDSFIANYGGWSRTHVPNTIRMTPKETIGQKQLEDLADVPEHWVKGRVALLGDAAHAMMPDMAQGASQAIIDSAGLLQAFMTHLDDPGTALRRYESIRKSGAYKVQGLSRQGMFADPNDFTTTVPSPIAERYMADVEV